MKRLFGEPPIEILAAAFAWRRRLVTTLRAAARARKPYVEVVIVSPPRPNLGNPGSLRPALAAQRALDCRVDKNALHQGLARDRLQQKAMLGTSSTRNQTVRAAITINPQTSPRKIQCSQK